MNEQKYYYAVFETNESNSIEISFPDIENAVTFINISEKETSKLISEAVTMAEDALAAVLAFEDEYPENSSFESIKDKNPTSFILPISVNKEIIERYKFENVTQDNR